MTREDIIRMAREAGLASIYSACDEPGVRYAYEDWDEELERFAALVTAAEREACADICDQHASVEGIAQRCAEQIRARSKT
jgi:cobalamin biosynthesis protein CbiG